MIKIQNYSVKVDDKEILSGLNLEIAKGEVMALMGPNGSGKSSLASSLIGHPRYEVSSGKVYFDGQEITSMSMEERSRKGIMMAFQYPSSIPGVTIRDLLLSALRQRGEKKSALELKNEVEKMALEMGIEKNLLGRGINEDFSGGEKKKFEILQMRILQPKFLILDEIDSGLDVDALKMIAKTVMTEVKKRGMTVLVITHYQRLLKYLRPDKVVLIKKGKVVEEGGEEVVKMIEKQGYKKYE